MNKDVDMTKNDYTKNDHDGKIKFSCNKCEFEAEKEGVIKKHMIQIHVSKTVKKRKVMESARKDSVSKELKLTEGEDVDDILSVGDMFEDDFTSSQVDQENIDKLIEECKKDLLDDDDEEEVDDKMEEEEKIEEPSNSATNLVKEMEEKYNIEKENNKILQGKLNNMEEMKKTYNKNMKELAATCKDQKQKILEMKATKVGVEAAKAKRELKNEKNKVTDLLTKLEAMTADKAKDVAEINSLNVRIKFYEEISEKGTAGASPANVNKEKCKDFENGVCSRNGCIFFHPDNECSQFRSNGKCNKRNCIELHKQQTCKFWLEGYCRFGDSCFKVETHQQEKLNSKPNKMKQMTQTMQQMMEQQQQMLQMIQQKQQPTEMVQQQSQMEMQQMMYSQQQPQQILNSQQQQTPPMTHQQRPQQMVQQKQMQPLQSVQQIQPMVQQKLQPMVQQQLQPMMQQQLRPIVQQQIRPQVQQQLLPQVQQQPRPPMQQQLQPMFQQQLRPEQMIQQQLVTQHQFLPGVQQNQRQQQGVQQQHLSQMVQPQQILSQEQEVQQPGGQAVGFGAGHHLSWSNVQQGEDMELTDQVESGGQLYHLLQ